MGYFAVSLLYEGALEWGEVDCVCEDGARG